MADPAALEAATAANAPAQDHHQDKGIVKRRTLDDAQKYEICVYCKENSDNGNRLTNKAVALYILGRYHIKVDESTVSRLRAQSDKRLSSAELANPKAKRHRQVLFPELERLLVERISDMIGKVVITDVFILQNGKELAQELGIPSEQLSFSDGWLSKFKTRHGLRGTVMPLKPLDLTGPSTIAPVRRRNNKRNTVDNSESSSTAKPKRVRVAPATQDVPLQITQPVQVRDPVAAPEMAYHASSDLAAPSRATRPAPSALNSGLEQAGLLMLSEDDEVDSSSSSSDESEDSSESEHEIQDLGVEQHLPLHPPAPESNDANNMGHGHGSMDSMDSMVNAATVAARVDGIPNVNENVRPAGATVISLEEQRRQQQRLRLQHQQQKEIQHRQQQDLQFERQHYQQQQQQQQQQQLQEQQPQPQPQLEEQQPQRQQRQSRQARQDRNHVAAEGSSSTRTSGNSAAPIQPPVSTSAMDADLALVDLGIAAAGLASSAGVAASIPTARRLQPVMTPARAALSMQLVDPVAASFQPEPLVEFSEAAQCVYTLRVFMQQQGFDRTQVDNLRDIYLTLSIKRRQQQEHHEQQQVEQQQQQQVEQQQRLQLEDTVQQPPSHPEDLVQRSQPGSSSSLYTQRGKARQRQPPRRR